MTQHVKGRLTSTLSSLDGHVHSVQDLEDVASAVNAQVDDGKVPLSVDHREDQGFVGHITRCWVDELEDHPGHHALYFEGKIEDGVDQSRLDSVSIAFFKNGFSLGDRATSELRVGLPRGFLSSDERHELAHSLQDLSKVRKLEIRDYYEHAVVEEVGGIIIFVITDPGVQAVLVEAAERIAETISEAIFRHRDKPVKAIKFDSATSGDLNVYVPVEADREATELAITEAFRTIRNRDSGR